MYREAPQTKQAHYSLSPWGTYVEYGFKNMVLGLPWRPVVKTLPSSAGSVGSIPGWGAKIPHASWPKNQNIKQKQYCNKFNKNFKKLVHIKKILKKRKKKKYSLHPVSRWSWISSLRLWLMSYTLTIGGVSLPLSLYIYTYTYLGVYKCLDWCIIKTPYRKTGRYFKLVGV